jgi:hypothetical protein
VTQIRGGKHEGIVRHRTHLTHLTPIDPHGADMPT